MDDETFERFLYTPREQKRLRRTLGRAPLADPVGRGLCPYCQHREARWRSVADRGDPSRIEVRVICSQCQRRMTYASGR